MLDENFQGVVEALGRHVDQFLMDWVQHPRRVPRAAEQGREEDGKNRLDDGIAPRLVVGEQKQVLADRTRGPGSWW